MTRNLLLIVSCGTIFFACNSSSEKNESVTADEQVPVQTVVDSTSIQAPADAAPGATVPMTMTPPTSPQTTPQGNSTATGMNPAHGEPGHRCDIAVGAPLNSPPGNTQAPANAPTIMTAPDAANPPPSPGPAVNNMPPSAPVNVNPAGSQAATAAGMNPPHGQPGHDCSIPVGSPLKK